MTAIIRDSSHRVKVALHGNLTRQVLPVQDPQGHTQDVPFYAVDHTPVIRAFDELVRNVDLEPNQSLKVVITAIPTNKVRHRSKIDQQDKLVKRELLDRLLDTWWAVYDSDHDEYVFVKHFLGAGNALFQILLSGSPLDACWHVTHYDIREYDGQVQLLVYDQDMAGEPDILDRDALRDYLSCFTDIKGHSVCTPAEFDAYFQPDPLRQKVAAAHLPRLELYTGRPPEDLNAVL